MIIKAIKSCGFERIYEGYKYAYQDNRSGYGKNLFNYLSHAMICIELEDLTSIEVFYLKSFAQNCIIVDKTYGNFENSEQKPDRYQYIDELLKIHDQMLQDDDINKDKSFIDQILPIGSVKYHVIAVFTGSGITSITGIMLNELFKDKGVFHEEYMGDMIIDKKLAELFFKEFYTYISNKMIDLDIVTEFMLNRKFYQYVDDIGCSLAYVNTPFGELQLFGNSNDKLQYQIAQIKKGQETTPYYIDNHIYLTFIFRTTFNTFLELYLNTKCVIDHENLKIVFLNNEVNIQEDIKTKYGVRLTNAISKIVEVKNELNESTSINLNKFNYIMNGNLITYSVKVPMNEISIISDLLNGDDEQKIIKEKLSNSYDIVTSIIG